MVSKKMKKWLNERPFKSQGSVIRGITFEEEQKLIRRLRKTAREERSKSKKAAKKRR